MLQMPTYREIEILQWVVNGWSTKEISTHLHISEHTVVSHRKSLMNKLDARNTACLVRRGYETNLIKLN